MILTETYKVFSTSWLTITENTITENKIRELSNIFENGNLTIFRFCDGEWVWTLKIEPYYSKKYQTRVGNDKIKKDKIDIVTTQMLDIINSNPEYFFSVDAYSLNEEKIKEKITPYLQKIPNRIGSGVFTIWCIYTGFKDLFSILNQRKVIVAGPKEMEKLPFRIEKNIITHMTDSIFFPEVTINEIDNYLSTNLTNDTVIIYSCGFTAKICLDYFYKKYGNYISQLDIGNTLCPFVGLNIRPWHKVMNEELKKYKIIS